MTSGTFVSEFREALQEAFVLVGLPLVFDLLLFDGVFLGLPHALAVYIVFGREISALFFGEQVLYHIIPLQRERNMCAASDQQPSTSI
jgi:hypothetical protein